jgi:hypothetical protein
LAKKNEIARLPKIINGKIFFKGKLAFTGETQRQGDVNVVEFSHTKSETDLKSELAKAISISTSSPKRGQADEIFSYLLTYGAEPFLRSRRLCSH